jgi:hypothetical protein
MKSPYVSAIHQNTCWWSMLLLLFFSTVTVAQELEPRIWANLPSGINFVGIGVGRSDGNILLDPTLPVEDLQSDLWLGSATYLRSLSVAGKSARIEVLLPFADAEWQGIAFGERRQRNVSGPGDLRIRFAYNLIGAPSLASQEFAGFRQKTIVGVALQVIAPSGQYDSDKLLNLGSNRWVLRPQIGLSHAWGQWGMELTATGWFFEDNDNYFGGQTLEQDPLYALQAHLYYFFRPGLWLGINTGYADGGSTVVNGQPLSTLQTNTRSGLALSIPLGRQHGLMFSYSTGLTTRIGADFNTVLVGYRYMW